MAADIRVVAATANLQKAHDLIESWVEYVNEAPDERDIPRLPMWATMLTMEQTLLMLQEYIESQA